MSTCEPGPFPLAQPNETGGTPAPRAESGQSDLIPACGICAFPAEVMATVPMCGERPRYPLCHDCLEDLSYSDYAEEVVPL